MKEFVFPLSSEFKDIYFVQGEGNGYYPYSHSLLIGDYLIDTGISNKNIRRLKKRFTINNVLLSHWHEDHILGNRLLPDAKFFCHPKDKHIVEDVRKIVEYYYCDNTPAESLFDLFFNSLKMQDTKIDEEIEDNQIIEIGNDYRLKVIHTPGHSAGHLCFFEENTKIAFLGDIDLSRFAFYAGKDSNLLDFENSIEKIKKFDIEIAVSSHKGVFRGKEEIQQKLNEYKSIVTKREQRILEQFTKSNSKNNLIKLEDLAKKNLIYKRYNPAEKEYDYIAEEIMIKMHLDKLVKNNKLESTEEGYILK